MLDNAYVSLYAEYSASRDTQRGGLSGEKIMPAIGDRNPLRVQYLDHSDERRSFSGFSGEITALTIAGFLTAFGALQTALDAVTLGTRSEQAWGELSVISNTVPASAAAQIETEVLVSCISDTTEAPWSQRIPTADYTAFNWIGDEAILAGAGASAATLALVAAIEGLMKHPDNGEDLEVVSIRVVE